LRFVVPWFASRSLAAVKVSWNIKGGETVSPGDELAVLTWDDGTTEELKAPTGCQGTVEATNRRIEFVRLGKRPSQWALRLEL